MILETLILALAMLIVLVVLVIVLKRQFDGQAARLNEMALKQTESLLGPLRQQIESFNHEFRQTSMASRDSTQQLNGQIKTLMELNSTISRDAENLTRALQGSSKVRGDWGENILRTVLEAAGMQKDVHFTLQQTKDQAGQTLRDAEGKHRRPDAVIVLPDKGKLVIDSKVSLNAYVNYCKASDDSERQAYGKQVAESVRKHILEIQRANYPAVLGKDCCQLVIMFVPTEGAYLTAFDHDPDLWKYAMDRQVMPASATHLLAVAQLAGRLWQRESQDRNAREIAKKAGAMYDKLADLVIKINQATQQIEKSLTTLNTAKNTLQRGPKSLCRIAEELKTMGAETQKAIPTQYAFDDDDAVVAHEGSPDVRTSGLEEECRD